MYILGFQCKPTYIKYEKNWRVLPGHFIKHKSLISEECVWIEHLKQKQTDFDAIFLEKCSNFTIIYILYTHTCKCNHFLLQLTLTMNDF